MKRYRHYTKDKAIILSVFGSVIEQQKYQELKKTIEKRFKGFDVFIAVSSRMVLKDLIKKGFDYKNLAQTLADVDMLGYKNIIVGSINLFPACEHDFVLKTAKGFREFSFSHIRVSNAILTRTKDTTLFLKELDETISKKDTANLYVIHGTPKLELGGLRSAAYTDEFLKMLNPNNITCSLEGAHPFYALKDAIIREVKAKGLKKVQIVPMLLVAGNHYIKDMFEIKDELNVHFKTKIVKSITKDEKFNLIEMPKIVDIVCDNIEEEITKLGHA
ncbi:MAG: sirohydrochlorin cobaltochelatase [Campylobacterota bacterium]|nr:sirohydrochlorin cobaltochelatase [Campylobacterota bacterium]